MRISLLILFLISFISLPLFSHGNSGDCSSECNDYFCEKENKENKENINEKLSDN